MAGLWLRQTSPPARLFLKASRWLVALPIVVTAFLMITGTFLFPNHNSPSTLGVAMTDLAMVSYRGIPLQSLRGPDGPTMMFDFYWFPNAFGWECPSCPAHIQNGWYVHLGGVSYAGPRTTFDPVTYMRRAAMDMKMPTSTYDCIPLDGKVGHEKCDNLFFQTFSENYGSRFRLNFAWARFMWYMLALLYGSVVLWSEWCIAYQPRRMKCSCLWRWQRRFCAQPRGTDEDMEALGEHMWDRVRLWAYARAFVFFFIAVSYDLWCSRAFIRYLNTADEVFPEGQRMNARLGRPFLVLSWINVVMVGVATIMIYKRRQLSGKSRSQDEQQLLDDAWAAEIEPLAGMSVGETGHQLLDDGDEDSMLPSSSSRIRL